MPPNRLMLLHAGTSRPEKGLKDVCNALLSLSDEQLNKVFLLRAGTVDPLDAPSLKRLQQKRAARVMDYFVPENELAMCYAAADWVLLPYRHQKESSGLLIHAAANVRPVIASDYGIIGHYVKEHNLGRLFSHCDIESLKRQIAEVIDSGEHHQWDLSGMEKFAHLNSPTAFRRTLIDGWLIA
ncbi:MAG: glycosyltransferase [Opitutales bacterium]|nr:glycosyltransferase [Opitutales bacterium]